MTISTALFIIAAVVGGFMLLVFYRAYLDAQLFRLARYEEWANRFYAAAKPVVQNPETPPQIISLMEGLNDLITERWSPTALMNVYSRKLRGESNSPNSEKSDERLSEYVKKHRNAVLHIAAAARAGLLAASYASIINGVQARAMIADAFIAADIEKFTVSAASDIRAVAESAHQRGAGLVPLIRGKLHA